VRRFNVSGLNWASVSMAAVPDEERACIVRMLEAAAVFQSESHKPKSLTMKINIPYNLKY
jgi:hypothetical protein